jgi:hypothetical protein
MVRRGGIRTLKEASSGTFHRALRRPYTKVLRLPIPPRARGTTYRPTRASNQPRSTAAEPARGVPPPAMKWARHPNLRKRPGRASRSPVGHRLYAESEDAGCRVGLQAAELPSVDETAITDTATHRRIQRTAPSAHYQVIDSRRLIDDSGRQHRQRGLRLARVIKRSNDRFDGVRCNREADLSRPLRSGTGQRLTKN